MVKYWTINDLKFIEENYTSMPTSEIAAELDRTVAAIRFQAHKLGLHKKIGRPIGYYALYNGDELVAQGTKKEIAEQTGLSINTLNFYSTPAARIHPHNYRKVLIRVD